MDDKLLIRIYDVGFGDCIYVQIPDGEDSFHLLIDCGTSAPAHTLRPAIDDVRSMLPQEEGKRRLDLLVATHPHADHIKGFDPVWFEGVRIARIWLTVFLKPDHPEAEKSLSFQALAHTAARGLLDRKGLHLAPATRALLRRSIWNPGALKALREGLAESSGIDAHYPLYVARDVADRLPAQDRKEHKLGFEQGITCFRGFREPATRLRVLAPEWDIDTHYLGQRQLGADPLVDHYLRAKAHQGGSETLSESLAQAAPKAEMPNDPRVPCNISERDFRLLRSYLFYSGLAFSQEDDALKNNTSVVLLLEWRGRRLLFPGDAEWQGAAVGASRRNSAWDVMLRIPEVRQVLLQPLDFLKVSHHGSHNGTPFLAGGREQVLDRMLSADRTKVVVSTVFGKHGRINPVPYPPLMEALGGLAANKCRYPEAREEKLRQVDQPQRTDLAPAVAGKKVRYVEVTLTPGG